jgi:hypothetical protein
VLPSKFFRLTDTQLFFIRQWADGKFRNDKPFTNDNLQAFPNGQQFVTDETITRGTLGNILGGSFCPGAEVCWIMRNPSIYTVPYRFKVNPDFIPTIGSSKFSKMNPFIPPQLSLSEDMSVGLEPGDLTKRSGIPWQADFNECYTQNIDVTYELWNKQYDASGNPYTPPNSKVSLTMWWPTHRPMQVYLQNGTQIEWSAYVPQTKQGDLQMVTAWKEFGFVVRRPGGKTPFYEVERNPEWIPKTDI